MKCALRMEEMLPSEFQQHMTKYLEEQHMEAIVDILLELDCSSSAHYSVSINLLDLLEKDLALPVEEELFTYF